MQAHIPTYAQMVGSRPDTRPLDVDTPRPAYVEVTPVPASAKPEPMVSPERQRLRRAAMHAKRVYPGPVGEVVSRELLTWEEFGFRLGSESLVLRLVDDILEKAPPDHSDGSSVQAFSRR